MDIQYLGGISECFPDFVAYTFMLLLGDEKITIRPESNYCKLSFNTGRMVFLEQFVDTITVKVTKLLVELNQRIGYACFQLQFYTSITGEKMMFDDICYINVPVRLIQHRAITNIEEIEDGE